MVCYEAWTVLPAWWSRRACRKSRR